MDNMTLKPCSGGHVPWVWGVTSTGPLFQAGCDKCREYGPKAPTDVGASHAWNGWRSAMDKVTKVEPLAVDREAAAPFERYMDKGTFLDLLDAFARHRLATRPATDLPEVGMLVERLRGVCERDDARRQSSLLKGFAMVETNDLRAAVSLIERLARPVGEGDVPFPRERIARMALAAMFGQEYNGDSLCDEAESIFHPVNPRALRAVQFADDLAAALSQGDDAR